MNGAKTMTNEQKIQLRMSEIEQRLNTISGHEGPPELPGPPLVGEWLPAESRPEVEALVTERTALEIRLAAIRTQKQDCP